MHKITVQHVFPNQRSVKQFFLKLQCPKKERNILDKILLYEARAEFCRFLGNGVSRKIAFEIY